MRCVPVRIVSHHNAAYSMLLQEKETLRSGACVADCSIQQLSASDDMLAAPCRQELDEISSLKHGQQAPCRVLCVMFLQASIGCPPI